MADENNGPITESYSTKEVDAPQGEVPTEVPAPNAEAEPASPSLSSEQLSWEENVRAQQALATQRLQEAAELRRVAEQTQREIMAREQAIRLQEERLAPLRELDALAENDPNLGATLTAHLQNYVPGSAKYATDPFVSQMQQQAQQIQAMALTFARTSLGQKYADFAANEAAVAETCRTYGLLRPGMTAEEIVRGLDAGYQLTQRPKQMAQAQQANEAAEQKKAQAATVGAAGPARQMNPVSNDLPTRRADGSLLSYDELAEMARARK